MKGVRRRPFTAHDPADQAQCARVPDSRAASKQKWVRNGPYRCVGGNRGMGLMPVVIGVETQLALYTQCGAAPTDS